MRWLGRAARTAGGGLLVAVGAALLVLPGPGLLLIAAGLAILAVDYRWARSLLRAVRARIDRARAAVRARRSARGRKAPVAVRERAKARNRAANVRMAAARAKARAKVRDDQTTPGEATPATAPADVPARGSRVTVG